MKIDNVISLLNKLGMDEGLTIQERTAINEACMNMMSLKRKQDTQIDFQGWEVKKLTMKDLREFVAEHEEVADDAKILVLEDDGMGYGANNGYCSELSINENEVHIWF